MAERFLGNFVGFTWRGDEKAPLFDPNVKNAFHTSPALWAFLRNTLENDVENGGWGLSPSDVDIAAHSLGNLVMWDALRINEQKTTDKLVNNVSSIEAAIWKEAFDPENDFNYHSAYENFETFTPDQQKQSSWRFWFNSIGHDPRESITGGVYHTYNRLDYALGLMQLNDSIWRGQTDRSGWFQQPPVYRSILNLYKIPTFVRSDAEGFDHLETHLYAANELNLPIGAMENPLATQNFDASTLGWRADKHSDFIDMPYSDVFSWYKTVLSDTSAIAIGKE